MKAQGDREQTRSPSLFAVHPLPDPVDEEAPGEEQDDVDPERKLRLVGVPVEDLFVFGNVGIVIGPSAEIQLRIEADATGHHIHGGAQDGAAHDEEGDPAGRLARKHLKKGAGPGRARR